jgi:hypothetical protein
MFQWLKDSWWWYLILNLIDKMKYLRQIADLLIIFNLRMRQARSLKKLNWTYQSLRWTHSYFILIMTTRFCLSFSYTLPLKNTLTSLIRWIKKRNLRKLLVDISPKKKSKMMKFPKYVKFVMKTLFPTKW